MKWFEKAKWQFAQQPISPAPLAIFRMFFGAVMLFSIIRFLYNGWVADLYLKPDFHFSYYGFEWVQAFGPWGMYTLYALMILSSLSVAHWGCTTASEQ